MKQESNEIYNFVANDCVLLDINGKAYPMTKELVKRAYEAEGLRMDIENFDLFDAPHQCELCQYQFGSEKTLSLHIQRHHIPSTKVFLCPSCPKTFLAARLVIRHLRNDHGKSMERIRLKRKSILKRRIRIDKVPKWCIVTVPVKKTDEEAENTQTFLDNTASQNMCTHCSRVFKRKASLTGHIPRCPSKPKKPLRESKS